MTERLDRIETNLEILSDRTGQLAQEVSNLRVSVSELRDEMRQSALELRQELKASTEAANEARRGDIEVMVGIVDTLSASIRDLREVQLAQIQGATADRIAWQGEIQRIWEFLLRQNPNGHGGQ